MRTFPADNLRVFVQNTDFPFHASKTESEFKGLELTFDELLGRLIKTLEIEVLITMKIHTHTPKRIIIGGRAGAWSVGDVSSSVQAGSAAEGRDTDGAKRGCFLESRGRGARLLPKPSVKNGTSYAAGAGGIADREPLSVRRLRSRRKAKRGR